MAVVAEAWRRHIAAPVAVALTGPRWGITGAGVCNSRTEAAMHLSAAATTCTSRSACHALRQGPAKGSCICVCICAYCVVCVATAGDFVTCWHRLVLVCWLAPGQHSPTICTTTARSGSRQAAVRSNAWPRVFSTNCGTQRSSRHNLQRGAATAGEQACLAYVLHQVCCSAQLDHLCQTWWWSGVYADNGSPASVHQAVLLRASLQHPVRPGSCMYVHAQACPVRHCRLVCMCLDAPRANVEL
jgi:hypothetical protein